MAQDDLLRQLSRVADDVGPALQPAGHHELLNSIVSTARRLFGAAACSLALLEDDEENLRFEVADGEGADAVVGLQIPSSQGIAGFVVRSGQALAINDVRQDPRFADSFAHETGYTPTSILAVPLETDRGVLGVLEILDRDPDAGARSQEMEVVGLFAQQAALAIENSRVFAGLGRQLLSALAKAAEGQDDGGLAAALTTIANESRGADADTAELAEVFAYLGELGPEERKAATRIVSALVSYARQARRFA